MKTTNYYNTFIEVAEDCPVEAAEIPPERSKKTAVRMQYEIIFDHPYQCTSDDVLFNVHALKHKISEEKNAEERKAFFSKGRACLRSSALGFIIDWEDRLDNAPIYLQISLRNIVLHLSEHHGDCIP